VFLAWLVSCLWQTRLYIRQRVPYGWWDKAEGSSGKVGCDVRNGEQWTCRQTVRWSGRDVNSQQIIDVWWSRCGYDSVCDKTDILLIRLLTRRAECVCEHLATLDSHDVRCVSHFSRCRDSRRRWRRGLRVPRRVLGLLTDTVSGRLRSMRRVVVVSTTWHWRRRLTTTTVVYTTTPQLSTLPHHRQTRLNWVRK